MVNNLQNHPMKSNFIEMCENNPDSTTTNVEVEALVRVTKQRLIVEQNMRAARNLTTGTIHEGVVKKEYWQRNLATLTQESVLSEELINRMSGPGMSANLEARRNSIIGDRMIKHEYASLSKILIILKFSSFWTN